MHLSRHHVVAGSECAVGQIKFIKRALVSPANQKRSYRAVCNGAARHTVPPDFRPVDVNHDAIVAFVAHFVAVARQHARIGDGLSKIGGDESVGRIAAIAYRCCFVAITVTQFRRPCRP